MYNEWCAKLLRKYSELSQNLTVNSMNGDTVQRRLYKGYSFRWTHPQLLE